MGTNEVEMVRDTYPELVSVVMDESDWRFVIDQLRLQARRSTGDSAERATFTADSIQDVLSSL